MDKILPEVDCYGLCVIKSTLNYLRLLGIKERQPVMGVIDVEAGGELFFESRTLLRSVNYDDMVFELVNRENVEGYDE